MKNNRKSTLVLSDYQLRSLFQNFCYDEKDIKKAIRDAKRSHSLINKEILF